MINNSLQGKPVFPTAPGPFLPDWDSLHGNATPDWYMDGKFGIFIHWGLYAVPAFGNEWYPRQMYSPGSREYQYHRETFGPQDQFGYKDFIPLFRAEQYDPAAWAALFRQAGARFVVPVAEHHDGFAMYDSALSGWTAAKMGPKRDLIGELAEVTRAAGLVFGVSSHRAEHWWFMNTGRDAPSDVQDSRFADFYGPAVSIHTTDHDSREWQPQPDAAYLHDWLARCCELVDRYQPQLFWFDWWIEQLVFTPYLQNFAAYYYNRAVAWKTGGVAINYKHDTFADGTAVLDVERGQLKDIRSSFWQTDTSISKNSWGYVAEQDYKTAAEIIADLVDIVSKNGALLLNIGPKPDGTIPAPEQEILLEIGRWLKQNGDAIYGTRPWQVYGEGPTQLEEGQFTDTKRQPYTARDVRFTTRGSTLYVSVMARPREEIVVEALGSQAGRIHADAIERITVLADGQPVAWRQEPRALAIRVPENLAGEHVFVFAIQLRQKPG